MKYIFLKRWSFHFWIFPSLFFFFFSLKCLKDWTKYNTSCPNCRKNITSDSDLLSFDSKWILWIRSDEYFSQRSSVSFFSLAFLIFIFETVSLQKKRKGTSKVMDANHEQMWKFVFLPCGFYLFSNCSPVLQKFCQVRARSTCLTDLESILIVIFHWTMRKQFWKIPGFDTGCH